MLPPLIGWIVGVTVSLLLMMSYSIIAQIRCCVESAGGVEWPGYPVMAGISMLGGLACGLVAALAVKLILRIFAWRRCR
jgi:hypothetical protein